MSADRRTLVELLKPVLDTYPNSPVALTGCRSLGIGRSSCEYDLFVVTDDARPDVSLRVGDEYLDIAFLLEGEALNPSEPELAVSVAHSTIVRDTALLLSSGTSAARAVLSENSKKSAQRRLASALKALGRAEEALRRGSVHDADFWLLVCAYDFGSAWLYSEEVNPAPSHLLTQMKRLSLGHPSRFDAFARGAGLEMASKAGCEDRLDAMGVLYDTADGSTGVGQARIAYEISRRKVVFLEAESQLAESYSFLGCELVKSLPKITAKILVGSSTSEHQPLPVSRLSVGERKVISENVIGRLGLVRTESSVMSALRTMKGEVSDLARFA